MKMQRIMFLSMLLSLVVCLTACHHKLHYSSYIENPTVSNLTGDQQKLLLGIERSGIQVIKQGVIFTFVISTDCFFSKDTRALKSNREQTLDRLAQFLNSYVQYFARPRITVAGYTDTTWLYPARDLLSLHYAETIATFLREDGLSSDAIVVLGQGDANPIASNHYPMGRTFNRRVVITVH